MEVEAKDIPIIQKFMTEYWKAIKEFYSAELTDEYSSKVNKDNVFKITSVGGPYTLIPHFEILGK